ncbi:glutamyl-tRNA(Gln) and/or aspartyl-tRNA(Asn) amidotransferase, A subunit [Halobacteroides halobius DSM 5150]|uniref:Glutamyl-tRNA(Gln) amidotransferase subunit A n=1 Tax=Halobacteroides halobius (strain ATCC 35273 / DSM 5150 / MD-1) TaxID=748449 RepID=L0KAY5_HALHC|nr:Asp-tRNA(Asn)/Glu-tRNA(Gln) amidotransferase subunit GatA [Halobacteroides halobius]AGB42176.1 glutamyl-tRNA(Gln) and/or aspartyl-tRNA(Asn) amidotransferase, A subunit [Halobacteroides halobius DSM 5150]
MELYQLTAHELHEKLTAGEVKAQEIVKSVYNQIEEVESDVQAYVTLTKEDALQRAKEVDQKLANGEEVSPLAGIPIAIKDNMSTAGVKTTCSSEILHNYKPPFDATVVEKLFAEDAVMVGKANMDEFAMGSSTENSGIQVTKNPCDLERVPGGSSGGSAAAVAAGEATIALGSDTGGSIRQPASFCGVVGLKPTYGLVSRYGLVAFASSLDQIGPITKDVTDCALTLNYIAGHDQYDSTSVEREIPDYTKSLTEDIAGLKIGVPKEYFGEGIDEEVKKSVWEAIEQLEELGAEYEEVSLPHTEYALSAYYLIAPAEASSNLARYDGVRYGLRSESNGLIDMFKETREEGFGDEVKRRIMLGTYALSSGYYDAYYKKAQKVRTLVREDFDQAFKEYDVLISPTSPTTAFEVGDKSDDPLEMYLSDICTIPVNLAGLPALSMPCGTDEQGLPIGLHIIGQAFDEETILQVAYAFEQATDTE